MRQTQAFHFPSLIVEQSAAPALHRVQPERRGGKIGLIIPPPALLTPYHEFVRNLGPPTTMSGTLLTAYLFSGPGSLSDNPPFYQGHNVDITRLSLQARLPYLFPYRR